MINSRDAEIGLTTYELWELAKEFAKILQEGSSSNFKAKIAIISPPERIENVKFLELCSNNRGLNVRSFISFEKLFDWIQSSSDVEEDFNS